MKRRISILAILALALACFALPAFAAGRPNVGPPTWANDENARAADNGEILYRCGTEKRGYHHEIPQDQIDRWISENRIVAGGVIPVYFHVIYGAEGNVSDAVIAQQIQVMNYNYAGKDYNGNTIPGAANTGYTFVLAAAPTHTRNNKWYRMTPGTGAEQQAKAALGQNQGSALNIYTCKPGQNLLGWSYFPQDMAGQTLDGVVIHYGSLPGQYLSPYNLGGTATHEVGHYLGLYHTFQDGCAGADTSPGCTTGGDRVCDTAAEATATSGCPAGKNTCASDGDDPIHNYMDYSTDACYTNFTAGQDTRMNTIVTAYRSWIGATRIANLEAPSTDRKDPYAEHGPAVADNGETVYRCATEVHGTPARAPAEDQIRQWMSENRVAAGGVIPVNFHVIYSGTAGTAPNYNAASGNVPESWLDAQIAVLNNNYAGRDYNGNVVSGAANTGYTFVKASVTRTSASGQRKKWFTMTPGSGAEAQAKAALVVNPTSSLNLYTAKPGQNLLGWATFPWNLAGNPTMDGVVIHFQSLPGGPLAPYNLGGTASHEVGHWVGLFHTFQGGCAGDCATTGDEVCDTPAEGTATSGCPGGKDTCPAAGLDPIHNYMDYSTDICYDNFTTGQDARADFMMANYRPAIGSARLADAGSIQNARSLENAMDKQLVEFRARPNPFNPRTKIEFGTVREGRVSVRVFDIQGRLVSTVVDRRLPAGNHEYDFDAGKLSSGVYLMVLKSEGRPQEVRRLSLLK